MPGFCKAATLDEIKANDYVLTPGRYVGAAEIEDDGIPFEEKIAALNQTPYRQMEESEKLDAVIRKNLVVLGYGGGEFIQTTLGEVVASGDGYDLVLFDNMERPESRKTS